MKLSRFLAFILVAVAVFLTGIGGLLDMARGSGEYSFSISRHHAWDDGIFLMLVALFLVVAF